MPTAPPGRIRVLAATVAAQLAAGEVVERPAWAVKELVENAIDSGATTIQIDIENGGTGRIRVTDDGCVTAKEDLALAPERHATSKMELAGDLFELLTLGFRGEALASLAAIARLLITSNFPFDEWTETFGSQRLTGALLDRLTHHVHILEMNGESFRLNHNVFGEHHSVS